MTILSDLGNVASSLVTNVETNLVNQLPSGLRSAVSGFLGLNSNNIGQAHTSGGAFRASSLSASQDWRCKLTWPDAKKDYGSGPLSFLTGGDTVIWPYTPSFSINYAASYDMIRTLQTNYATPAYQSSEISNITIEGIFTASTMQEANYLYAVLHFFKSATKGHNFEASNAASKAGDPPKVLKLTYLGKGGINSMPVVVQQLALNYPKDVDYIRTNMLAGIQPSSPDGPTPLSKAVEASMVPAEISIAVTLVPAYSRADMISANYTTTKFINGDLLKNGYF